MFIDSREHVLRRVGTRWPGRNALSPRWKLKGNDLLKAYEYFIYPRPASQFFHLTFFIPGLHIKFALRHGRILAGHQEWGIELLGPITGFYKLPFSWSRRFLGHAHWPPYLFITFYLKNKLRCHLNVAWTVSLLRSHPVLKLHEQHLR